METIFVVVLGNGNLFSIRARNHRDVCEWVMANDAINSIGILMVAVSTDKI